MNTSGIYSMITTFFLVVTIVFIVIGLLYLNYSVSSQEGTIFQGAEVFEKANDVKDNVLHCYGKLSSEKVADANYLKNCAGKFLAGSKPEAKGISMEVMGFLRCTQEISELGTLSGCSQRFIYYLNVDENFQRCLGRMVVCT